MNPSVPTSVIMLLITDLLHEAGVIDDDGQAKARAYLDKIPPYLKLTRDDYEKWRDDNINNPS